MRIKLFLIALITALGQVAPAAAAQAKELDAAESRFARLEESRHAFEKALELNPRDVLSLHFLAQVYEAEAELLSKTLAEPRRDMSADEVRRVRAEVKRLQAKADEIRMLLKWLTDGNPGDLWDQPLPETRRPPALLGTRSRNKE